jgi:hypothetical protein
MRAYMSLINTVLANAEVSHSYMDEGSVIVNLLLRSWGYLSLCQYTKCTTEHFVEHSPDTFITN